MMEGDDAKLDKMTKIMKSIPIKEKFVVEENQHVHLDGKESTASTKNPQKHTVNK